MSNVHQDILNAVEEYLAEATKFEEKGVKASAARARKALGDIGKLTKVRRQEIQDKKNNM
jgi:N-glycosylase/DNA lyase